jgi:hypothetical protein
VEISDVAELRGWLRGVDLFNPVSRCSRKVLILMIDRKIDNGGNGEFVIQFSFQFSTDRAVGFAQKFFDDATIDDHPGHVRV